MASSGESPADVAPSGADRTAATRRPGVAALQLVVLRLQTSRSTFRRYRRLAPERLARSGHAMARRWASVVQVRVPALEPWFFAYPQAVGRQTEPALLPAALAAQRRWEGLRSGGTSSGRQRNARPKTYGCEGGNPRTTFDFTVTARSAGASACVPHSAAYTRGRCFDLVCAGA